jgi:hypothetical protein
MKHSILAALGLIAVGASVCLAGVPPPATPEPGTFIMLATAAVGGAGYAVWRSRRKK